VQNFASLWLSLGVTASEGKAALPLHPDAVADPTISLLTLIIDSLPMLKACVLISGSNMIECASFIFFLFSYL